MKTLPAPTESESVQEITTDMIRNWAHAIALPSLPAEEVLAVTISMLLEGGAEDDVDFVRGAITRANKLITARIEAAKGEHHD